MKLITKILNSIAFVGLALTCQSQNSADLALALQLTPKPKLVENHTYNYQGRNEVQELSSLLFTGYKKYVSSQDSRNCNFSPSCSVYGLQAVQKNGLVLGFFSTFDRLMRCHPFALEQYATHPKNTLALDAS